MNKIRMRPTKIYNIIDLRKVIRMYRQFEREPLKTFVASDFSHANIKKVRSYLFLLVKLGLIGEVEAFSNTGKNYIYRRQAQGYRLIQRSEPKEDNLSDLIERIDICLEQQKENKSAQQSGNKNLNTPTTTHKSYYTGRNIHNRK